MGGLHRRVCHTAERASKGSICRNLHSRLKPAHELPGTSAGAPSQLNEDGGNGHHRGNCHRSAHSSTGDPHRLSGSYPHDATCHGTSGISQTVQLTGRIPVAPSSEVDAIPRCPRICALGPRTLGVVGNEEADRLATSAHGDRSVALWTTQMPPPSKTPFWIMHNGRAIPRRPRRFLREQDKKITADLLVKQVNAVPDRPTQTPSDVKHIINALQ